MRRVPFECEQGGDAQRGPAAVATPHMLGLPATKLNWSSGLAAAQDSRMVRNVHKNTGYDWSVTD
jgi:hypothetical protein